MTNGSTSVIEWGTSTSAVSFRASQVNPLRYVEQFPPRHEKDAQHDARVGTNTLVIDDLSGGIWDSALLGDWRKDKNRVWYNEGIQCHVPGIAALPYALTTTADLIVADFSTYRNANKRVHGLLYDRRAYMCVGPYLIKDTSTSSPVPIVPSTNDNITDNVGCVVDATWNSTRYFTIGAQDGTTDGIKGTTDPTANDITWASIFTYTSGDCCDWIIPIPELSINVMSGIFSGVRMVGYVYETDALLTMPTPFDLSTSVSPTATTYATNQTFPGVVANETSIGSIAWTDATNATSLSNVAPVSETFATVSLTDDGATGEISNYLYADTFGFALASTDLVTGVEVMVFGKATTPNGGGSLADMDYRSVTLFNTSGAAFGEDMAAGTPPDITTVSGMVQASVFPTDGTGNANLWGCALTPTIVNNAAFGVGVAVRKNGTTGTDSTVSIGAIAMTIWYQRGLTLQSTTKSVGNYTQRTAQSAYWVNQANITASDDSKATSTWQTGAGSSDPTTQAWTYGYGFTLPTNAIISGIVATVERGETNAAANGNDETIQMLKAFAATGDNNSFANGLEYSTTDEAVSYGSATDLWGTTWTAANINHPGFGLIVQSKLDSNAVTIDHVSITVYWYLPLTIIEFPTGGTAVLLAGAPTAGTRRIAAIVPDVNSRSGITTRRRLAYLDITSVGVASVSYPDTQMVTVNHVHPYLGGVVAIGGGSGLAANRVVFIGSDGYARDLGFPVAWGGTDVSIHQVFTRGDVLIVDTATSSSSDFQRWLYHDGKWHASWVLQSKSDTSVLNNSIFPLFWAETPYFATQGFAYRLMPDESGNLNVGREFVPDDPMDDPHLLNTTVVKHDGPLYVQVAQLDCGPVEMLKTLTQLQCQSLRIDDSTSYGSLRVLVDTGRDLTIASAEVDQTFDAVAETFTDRNLASSSDPGVTFDTLVIRLIGNHQASSAETPNLLPVNFSFTSQWPAQEEVTFTLPADQQEYPLQTILTRLATLQSTKNVQRLLGAGFDDPMAWLPERTAIKYKPATSTSLTSWGDIESAQITFRVSPGATA